ncbi:MAG: hypothetical protein ABMA26_11160 [Limisphaerales bacterium]
MKTFALQPFVVICALLLEGASARAQTTPQRAVTPARMLSLPGRALAPIATPNRPFSVTNLSQTLPAALRPKARDFNLDTAVARILADMKLIGIVGEFELMVTNGAKAEISVFPLLVHVLDGQVRTEMDITAAPAAVMSTGPFTAIRSVGLTRVINLTQVQPNLRVTSQVFPEAKCYVTRELPAEDLLMLIRIEKRSLGQEILGGIPCDKSIVSLVYPTGDKREGRVWSAARVLRQVQFDVGDSRLTVRVQDSQGVADLQAQDIAEQKLALFELPKGYDKCPDLEYVVTRFHAQQQRGRR